MPIPTDGLVEITLQQRLFGQELVNVFYYWDSTNASIANMPGIAAAFDAVMMSDLAIVTNVALKFENIKVRDVFGINPDVNAVPSQADGDLLGEALPSFLAARLDLEPSTKETRRGYKRFAGLEETQQSDGELTVAAIIAWSAIVTALQTSLIVGPSTYQPVIRGLATLANPTRNVVNPVALVTLSNLITSQTSRKV